MENFLEVMQKWYQQVSSSWVLKLESEEISRIIKNIDGVYLVQMGGSLDVTHSKKSQIFMHIRFMSQFISGSILSVQTGWQELPLLSNSVDVIVLVHLLEFIDYPARLLQEIFRALKPNGQLIILGFNPWSLWGLKKLFPEVFHGMGGFGRVRKSNDG
ncbi:class I SAM-dependent methyltransferase [Coxiella-like endosymbiont]|uniref:class I SAM-dependent methyltransferase n=1 Tax=Coxiella-like endosymbiont TaxID=1592897 RepID=UPI00215ACC19|nr:class I SAM-dependent methyltransferase [Coxiella-like endosymbiont]UVE59594.1 class I SAM-dependent methyltransferase [Coxiella-like endosymbiont]